MTSTHTLTAFVRHSDVAIVLSGGGALAAYEVGILRAVLSGRTAATNYQSVDPGVISGTSAGAVNAALLMSHLDRGIPQALDALTRVWLDEFASTMSRNNGVYRVRFNPLQLMDLGALIRNPMQPVADFVNDIRSLTRTLADRSLKFALSTGALESRIAEFVDLAAFVASEALPRTLRRVLDLGSVEHSHRALRIAATNWQSGRLAVFENRHMTGERGYMALCASAAIPGIFPPVEVEGEMYVDGSLVLNTPLKPAIDAGATTLHVVYVDAKVDDIPLARRASSLDVFERSRAITFAAAACKDVETVKLINEGLKFPPLGSPSLLSGNAGQLILNGRPRNGQGRPFRPITIHRYHPLDDMVEGLGILDFSRSTIQRLIDRGYQDGLQHNCDRNECVRPTD
jgi:predicted acylesterase/phospholipase RssA